MHSILDRQTVDGYRWTHIWYVVSQQYQWIESTAVLYCLKLVWILNDWELDTADAVKMMASIDGDTRV